MRVGVKAMIKPKPQTYIAKIPGFPRILLLPFFPVLFGEGLGLHVCFRAWGAEIGCKVLGPGLGGVVGARSFLGIAPRVCGYTLH